MSLIEPKKSTQADGLTFKRDQKGVDAHEKREIGNILTQTKKKMLKMMGQKCSNCCQRQATGSEYWMMLNLYAKILVVLMVLIMIIGFYKRFGANCNFRQICKYDTKNPKKLSSNIQKKAHVRYY